MRILHLTELFSTLSEPFIYDQLLEQRVQGVDVELATLYRVNNEERPFDPVHVLAKPRPWNLRWIHTLIMTRAGRDFDPRPREVAVRARLRRLIRRTDPDVVHAHFGPAGWVGASVAQESGVPLVVTFMGSDVFVLGHDPVWGRRYREEVFPTAAAVIGISDHLCEQLGGMGAPDDRLHRIHLGIRPDDFPYSDPSTRLEGKVVRCLHVGRLVAKKSPLDLLRAFRTAVDLNIGTTPGLVTITPAADERVVIVGIDLRDTAGTGTPTLVVDGAANLANPVVAHGTDLSLVIPISGDTVGGVVTVTFASTSVTAGDLIVSYKLQKAVVTAL